jgi:large subunit ribosomal protein L4
MPVVDVVNLEGKKVGQVELADAVFAAKVNPHLLHETVRWYLAGQRAGTHKTKGRGEVSGAGRKLWKQKGTGRARVGSIRSSIWRKGGTVHGPQPRDYSYRLPHKVVLGALRSALSAKLAEQKLTVVDGWELDSHKTKALRVSLDRLNADARTALLVAHGENRNLDLASRNLAGVKLVRPAALQPYDLLRHDHLIVSKEAAVRLGSSLLAVRPAPAELIGTIAPAPAAQKPAAAAKKKVAAARKGSGAKKPADKKRTAAKAGKKKEKD